ncbi:endonuclease/exonuclease/phosphatase family protein [Streptomyces sp. NPDC014006]|uniref:endonuclease/exonuclease/phosphatase family protein n=1 Tax=Streptomyces sp. NPDC014006 TaxID=3364870 RepID=UPI003700079D
MFPTVLRAVSRRPGRRGRRILAALAVLLGLATAAALLQTAGPTPSAASGGSLTVATWNMCGVRQWGCAGTGSRQAKKAQVELLVHAGGAQVVFLQEACAADVEAVRAELGDRWHTAFHSYAWGDRSGRVSTVRCAEPDQGAAGLAILSAFPLSAVGTVPAQQPSVGLRRGILCASLTARAVRLCTAHLSPAGSDRAHPRWELRDDQLKALVTAVPQRRTVYGGDLNVRPPGSGNPSTWVWPPGPYTVHRECDQASPTARSGRATHRSGHKLDYLFTGFPRTRCQVYDTSASDHSALLVEVRTA